jgi:septal ring factor EnvC (AmiA/AmiB activator)
MKRIKVVVLAVMSVCLILNSTLVFAKTDKITDGTSSKQNFESKTVQQWQKELKPLFDEIRINKTETIQLRNQLIQLRNNAVAKINDLRQQNGNLTDEQMKALLAPLKGFLQTLKEDKAEIDGQLGDVQQQVVDLRKAKKEQDITQAKITLHNIIIVQEQRITALKATIEDLEDFLD